MQQDTAPEFRLQNGDILFIQVALVDCSYDTLDEANATKSARAILEDSEARLFSFLPSLPATIF